MSAEAFCSSSCEEREEREEREENDVTETWNTLLRTPMGRLRATTIIEGISYLFLAGVAMPLKYAFDMPAAVRVGGWIHGVLFVAVMATLADVFFRRQLSFSRATMVVIATLWPFGAFIVDHLLRGAWAPTRLRSDVASDSTLRRGENMCVQLIAPAIACIGRKVVLASLFNVGAPVPPAVPRKNAFRRPPFVFRKKLSLSLKR